MVAVPVNAATLARWQQALQALADNLQFRGISKVGAARAARRIAEEMDGVAIKAPAPRSPVVVLTVRPKKTFVTHAGANHADGFVPLCMERQMHVSPEDWVLRSGGAVTCRRCLDAIVRRQS